MRQRLAKEAKLRSKAGNNGSDDDDDDSDDSDAPAAAVKRKSKKAYAGLSFFYSTNLINYYIHSFARPPSPQELSSKIPVGRARKVVTEPAVRVRDPRFEDLSGR